MPRDTKPLVLGIHGFGRKPTAHQLEEAWEKAIAEGLRRNCGVEAPLAEQFELIYWFDNFGGEPVAQDDPPYRHATGDGPLPSYEHAWHHEVARVVGEGIELVFDQLMTSIGLHDAARDLIDRVHAGCRRYHAGREHLASSQDELAQALLANAHRPVLLIAHSVGSVIAYETLRQLEGSGDLPEITLFTTGSPLGMPFVTADMLRKQGPNRVPHNLVEWVNFADRRDPITFDAHLKDDYPANAAAVEIVDRLVYNAYEMPGEPSSLVDRFSQYHSIYGYLRTPELSQRLRHFLGH